PSLSAAPSVSTAPSTAPSPSLIGTVTFGTGLNPDTKEVTGPTTTFSAGVAFAHSIKLTAPFTVKFIQEEVVRVAAGGAETIVQTRVGSDLQVTPTSKIAGFRVKDAKVLIDGWGKGNFILRVYRGAELVAQGPFTLQ
ncbi:MAG: hypothetical protein ABI978_07240, partial [Chloroflexota bacterium]